VYLDFDHNVHVAVMAWKLNYRVMLLASSRQDDDRPAITSDSAGKSEASRLSKKAKTQ
jgi:hypothetical protein